MWPANVTGSRDGACASPPPGIAAPPIPDSDPQHTDETWEAVRSSATMSGLGSRRETRRRGGVSQTSRSSPASEPRSLFERGSDVTPGSTLTHAKGVTPRSSKFTALVLGPRRIIINDTNSITPSAFHHFKTTPPQEGYRSIDGLADVSLWITADGDWFRWMTTEYREMKTLGLCEEEFASFAKEHLLRPEWRSHTVSEDRQWRAERMLQLVCPPKENAHWRKPPILESTDAEVEWAWDIRSDCTYWLSLKGFNPKYRFQIQNCAFVREWITCPYLSTEFKRDGQSEDTATAQVAAAGSIALFNRFQLHAEALKANPDLGGDTSIRHYGLTLVGPKFVFWVLQPTLDEGCWNGCTMKRLTGADCTDEYGMREMVDWINEIHRWGLSAHGPSCERDIKAILKLGGVRTSELHEGLPGDLE